MPNISHEIPKNNQWWFKSSPLRSEVESFAFIELAIEGRTCPLERSGAGVDARPTWSFKFLREDDRVFWRSLAGQTVKFEFLGGTDSRPVTDTDLEDESCGKATPARNAGARAGASEITTAGGLPRRPENPLFDSYIFADWSANNRPKTGRDSIWIAAGTWEGEGLELAYEDGGALNVPTREAATDELARILTDNLKRGLRTLVCLDFPYSYPDCLCTRIIAGVPLGNGPYQGSLIASMAENIQDNAANNSNRFEVAANLNQLIQAKDVNHPFWGRPTHLLLEHLPPTRPKPRQAPPTFKEYRVIEEVLRVGGRRPFSVWQLFGNGSVGSQTLVGLPRLAELRQHPSLRDASLVWPFESGWTTRFPETARIVHAEFWPGALPLDPDLHPVRDAAQVISAVLWAAGQDSRNTLGAFFDPLPQDDPRRLTAAIEGWILGCVGV